MVERDPAVELIDINDRSFALEKVLIRGRRAAAKIWKKNEQKHRCRCQGQGYLVPADGKGIYMPSLAAVLPPYGDEKGVGQDETGQSDEVGSIARQTGEAPESRDSGQ